MNLIDAYLEGNPKLRRIGDECEGKLENLFGLGLRDISTR